MTQTTDYSRWLIVPAAAWVTLFFLIPLLIVVAISLVQAGAPVEWALDGSAYARLLDPIHLYILGRSIGLATAATVLCLLLGFPLAVWLARQPRTRRTFFYFLVLVPLWANSLILVYSWMVLLRPDGAIDSILTLLGWREENSASLLYTPGAVLLGLVYWYLPFMIYPLYAVLDKLDWRLIEAARDLGATRVQVFSRVLWPLSRAGVVTGCLLVFIESLGAFVVPDLLGGAKTMMLGNLVQSRFLSVPQDWPLGAALVVCLVVIAGLAFWQITRRGKVEA